MSLFTDFRNVGTSLLAQQVQLRTGVNLRPGGSNSTQAVAAQRAPAAAATGTPAEPRIVQNGLRATDGGSNGLFGGIHPALMVVGVIVAIAGIVMIARK